MEETKTIAEKKPSKKQTQKEVFQKLSGALADYRPNLNGKKFEIKLKKASKLFAADIAKAVAKQKQQLKKPAKIKAVKDNLPGQGAAEAVV